MDKSFKGMSIYQNQPFIKWFVIRLSRMIKLGTRTLFVKDQIDKWVLSGGQMNMGLPVLAKL